MTFGSNFVNMRNKNGYVNKLTCKKLTHLEEAPDEMKGDIIGSDIVILIFYDYTAITQKSEVVVLAVTHFTHCDSHKTSSI